MIDIAWASTLIHPWSAKKPSVGLIIPYAKPTTSKGKIAKIAEQEKLDIILTTEAVAYSKSPDITQKVIDALKK